VFKTYMRKLCVVHDEHGTTMQLSLSSNDFLARGEHSLGKGDYQGCSEFNPLYIFSQQEHAHFEQMTDKTDRNNANAPNRRVTALLFRPGSRIDPSKWPCPTAHEGADGCRTRFWSDGEQRRSARLADKPRMFQTSKDTFACRFYHRLAMSSPCERIL